LKRVIFHDNITEIGVRAFWNSGIKGKVVIPKKVTKIEKYTFARCPNLKRVGLHDKIRKIMKMFSLVVEEKEKWLLKECTCVSYHEPYSIWIVWID
jgi:hypothetical protein